MNRRAWAAAALLGAAPLRAAEDAATAGRLLADSLNARASGLAEAATALTGDLTALSFNPAGLPLMVRNEAVGRFQRSVGEVASGALGCGGRSGRLGWGLGAAYLDAGTIDLAFSDGRRFTRRAERDFAGQLAVGAALSDSFFVGVGGRFISSTLVQEYKASAVAADAGLVLLMPVEGWRVGAAVRNMGGELTYDRQGDPLPGEVRVGTAFSYAPQRRGQKLDDPSTFEWYARDQEDTPVFTVLLDGVRDREGGTSAAVGFEWTRWPKAAFRAGYGAGQNATGFTLGFGLNLLKFSLDYSWRMVDELSDAHRVSFSAYWD